MVSPVSTERLVILPFAVAYTVEINGSFVFAGASVETLSPTLPSSVSISASFSPLSTKSPFLHIIRLIVRLIQN